MVLSISTLLLLTPLPLVIGLARGGEFAADVSAEEEGLIAALAGPRTPGPLTLAGVASVTNSRGSKRRKSLPSERLAFFFIILASYVI